MHTYMNISFHLPRYGVKDSCEIEPIVAFDG